MSAESVKARVEQVYREDSRRILATLIRLLGDFDLAEEALHEAFFEFEVRDAVHQKPADAIGSLEHRHEMPGFVELRRAR